MYIGAIAAATYLHDVDCISHRDYVHDLQQDLDDILSPVEAVIVQHDPVGRPLLLFGDIPAMMDMRIS